MKVLEKTRSYHGQRTVTAGSVPERAAQGARAGFNLSGQWHQAAGSSGLLRPVRGPAQELGEPDGLQARYLDGRASAQCPPAVRRGCGGRGARPGGDRLTGEPAGTLVRTA